MPIFLAGKKASFTASFIVCHVLKPKCYLKTIWVLEENEVNGNFNFHFNFSQNPLMTIFSL